MTNIYIKRPMIYIASSYTDGDNFVNVRRQIDIAEQLVEIGCVPIWPLSAAFWNMVYYHDWEYWIGLSYELILRCDGILRLNYKSKGADLEVKFAKENKIPVFYNIDTLKEFVDNQRNKRYQSGYTKPDMIGTITVDDIKYNIGVLKFDSE